MAHFDGGLPEGLEAEPTAVLHVDDVAIVPLQRPMEAHDRLEDQTLTLVQLLLEHLQSVHLARRSTHR